MRVIVFYCEELLLSENTIFCQKIPSSIRKYHIHYSYLVTKHHLWSGNIMFNQKTLTSLRYQEASNSFSDKKHLHLSEGIIFRPEAPYYVRKMHFLSDNIICQLASSSVSRTIPTVRKPLLSSESSSVRKNYPL